MPRLPRHRKSTLRSAATLQMNSPTWSVSPVSPTTFAKPRSRAFFRYDATVAREMRSVASFAWRTREYASTPASAASSKPSPRTEYWPMCERIAAARTISSSRSGFIIWTQARNADSAFLESSTATM
eukprot:Amastigsp_a348319_22.p6 type:complete len:127 gc:universal Amastigsp_a348319_22:423-43(-)